MEQLPRQTGYEFEPDAATLVAWEARGHMLAYRDSDPDSVQAEQALYDARQSFGRLVEMTQPKLLQSAMSRTAGQTEDCREILQETYRRAFTHIHKFRQDSQVNTWLHSIMFNRLSSFYKKKSRDPVALEINEQELPFWTPPKSMEDPEIAVLMHELQEELKADLLQLHPRQRIALVLHHAFSISHKEIGEIIGASETASKILVTRALKRIREIKGLQ